MAVLLTLHIFAVFYLQLQAVPWAAVPVLMAIICWLNVGLFIIAHDAMHGSLAPGRPRLNRAFGRAALLLYAGFWFDTLLPKHMAHHQHPGSDRDPDFSSNHPARFWPWYMEFFRRYFGLRQLLLLSMIVAVYLWLGASYPNLLLFWAVPAILSSLQLFYFGTYLPHRHDEQPFADHHNARTNQFSWLMSLLSCFHFGYHHEHHLAPHVPWWRLPFVHRDRQAPR
jgi:beta-carotene ketolase (CrtW type)